MESHDQLRLEETRHIRRVDWMAEYAQIVMKRVKVAI